MTGGGCARCGAWGTLEYDIRYGMCWKCIPNGVFAPLRDEASIKRGLISWYIYVQYNERYRAWLEILIHVFTDNSSLEEGEYPDEGAIECTVHTLRAIKNSE